MSFSSDVKEELSMIYPSARHCQIAEIAAILSACGRVYEDAQQKFSVVVTSESIRVARKYFTLLKKSFNISSDISIRCNDRSQKGRVYVIAVTDDKRARQILYAARFLSPTTGSCDLESPVDHVLLQSRCCVRAFLRGTFLAEGSVSNPQKTYHFEISCLQEEKAWQIIDLMRQFDIQGKMIQRKKHYVVYIKDSAQIVDMLNVIGAHNSLMEMENVRILKDVRNSVNRQVNCETANINKTVSAAVRQVEDITLIRDSIGFDQLPENLKETAMLRLEHPEATLEELGAMHSTPIGKSGVNHRLRKLEKIADEMRCHER